MTSDNWLWALPLTVVALGCVFLRVRDLAARTRGPRAANSPSFLVRAFVSRLLLWTGLGWVLAWPLGWVAGWGWGGQVLLALLGLLLGAAGVPEIGAGAVLVYTLWQPDQTLLLWWVVPIIGAATVRVLLRSEPWPEGPDPVRSALRQVLTYGDIIQPPAVLDRVWQALHLIVGAVPVLLAVVLPFPGAGPLLWWLRVLAGILVAVQVWWFHSLQGGLTRHVRRGSRIGSAAVIGVAVGVAASPVGAGLVQLWLLLPAPGPVGGGLLVLVDFAVLWLGARPVRLLDTGNRASRRVHALAGGFRDAFLRRGLFVFAAAGLWHPMPELLVGAVLLVGVELWFCVRGVLRAEMQVLYLADAAYLLDIGANGRQKVFGCWLYDSFLAHPRRPDLAMTTFLTLRAVMSSRGGVMPGMRLVVGRVPQLTGTAALQWTEVADEALDLVESEVVPRYPAEHRELLDRELARARADYQLARAIVFQSLNWRDDSLAAWRAAASHAHAAGAVNVAASAHGSAASLLANRLARPRDALAELDASLRDEGLAPLVRRFVLVVAAAAHLQMDDEDTARSLLTKARKLPMDRAGWAAAVAEDAGSSVTLLGGRGTLTTEVTAMESMLTAMLDGGEVMESTPHPLMGIPAMTLATRAMAALSRGDEARAAELLHTAVRIGERDGHLTWVHNANVLLSDISGDFVTAYRYASAAIDALEEMRGRVLDADLRLGAAADPHRSTYDVAASVLVAKGASDAPGWPSRPYATAFEFVERARSRVFLEMLGEAATRSVPAELADLAAAEADAAHDFQLAVQAQAGVSDTERPAVLERVRAVRARLDEAWRALAESGSDGDRYARLRRGEPVSYDEVRAHLTDGTLLVEYFVTREWTFLFFVRAGEEEPDFAVVELGRDGVRAAAAELRADPRRCSGDAFAPLVRPLLDRCADGERLCLVPHDALHLVPLHAVEVDGVPLAERNPVSYLPSAGMLRYTTVDSERSAGVVLMADSRADRPLAHARVQTAEIAELFESPTEVLLGDEVTTDAVAAVAAGVWHVACHGEFDQGDPLRSGIVLADGRCTVADLMSLRLNCELVTFSACETGVAEQAPGDELIGLTRALIYAGARAVLVSLWQVDEISTSILMRGFYGALTAGADKADALQRAQHDLRTMTAAEAIAYCERARRHVDDPAVLERDIADLRFRARDFTAAAREYAMLADRTAPDTAEYRDLTAAVARARRAARSGQPADYDVRPYLHPYHWAAFVLVGDWR